MDLIYVMIFFISMMFEEIDNVIMKKVNIRSFKKEKILFISDEESLLQCAQRCKFMDSDAKIDFRNSRCRCMKYETDDKLQNHGTLTEHFVAQKIMKMKEPIHGGWSSWKNYTDCTKSCGSGTLEQRRDCDSPTPERGGADCKGEKKRTVKCNTHECPIVNVARGKAASQSSILHNDYNCLPWRAVDGKSYTHAFTRYQANPWWQVDMGEVKVIKDIRLTAGVKSSYNLGLIVETRKNNVDSWMLCSDIGDQKQRIKSFKCINERSSIAKFLRIRSNKTCYLCPYEVEIFGH